MSGDGKKQQADRALAVEQVERRLPPTKVVPHLTPEERAARGRATRAELPRSDHAGWDPPPLRHDPVALLEEQAKTRVPELVPIRYGRMLVSPFTFFRGGAYLMAADLSGQPRTGLTVQLCGDAHLMNFGMFSAPDRRLVFSLNDFDETLPGPFEWDLKRLAASFAVAGRDIGLPAKERELINQGVARGYREAMAEFAAMSDLAVWYARLDVEAMLEQLRSTAKPKVLKRLKHDMAKARAKDSIKAFDKLVRYVDGRPRIVGDPPLIVPIEDLSGFEAEAIESYAREVVRAYRRTLVSDRRRLLERYRYVHAARKVVGVGSVGTRAFIMLMLGRDDSDPLFLQMKQTEASVLEPFLGRSRYASHGQRVVEGQRLMLAASDIFLGWIRTTGVDGVKRDFYVRQLWDGKGSAVVDAMDAKQLGFYAGLCSWTLARAHARSGDPIAIASYLGTGTTFDRALATFAEAYADQNEADYAALKAAADSGRVQVEYGL
jgi:uncharacterized protein (DUF2252 family)